MPIRDFSGFTDPCGAIDVWQYLTCPQIALSEGNEDASVVGEVLVAIGVRSGEKASSTWILPFYTFVRNAGGNEK